MAGRLLPTETAKLAREDDDRPVLDLVWPDHLTADDRMLLTELAERNMALHGTGLLGLVLSGSAARGTTTDHSDLDVYVVLSDEAARAYTASRCPDLDEIPVSLTDLETVPPFASAGWWQRWSFAWAPTLLDRTGGRIPAAANRQATLTPEESQAVLIDHDRLDGWLNLAYRALKAHRDGHVIESRLDAAESVPWLLDVVFALSGRVRPYNKFLRWELSQHPIEGWPTEAVMPLVQRLLDGDAAAIRDVFTRVVKACAQHDADRGDQRLSTTVAGWGDALTLFHI